MCGRFTQTATWEDLARLYRIAEDVPALNLPARYNVLPGTDVALVRTVKADDEDASGTSGREIKREIRRLRWGFRPPWKADPPFPINARAETLFSSGMWREAARRRRCVIPANGFFEPIGPKRAKRPQMYFQLPEGALMSIAGVWTRRPGGESGAEDNGYDSFAVITTEPNETVAPVHSRMPALLGAEDIERWLDRETPEAQLASLLRPWDGPALEHWDVGQAVNRRDADGPPCIAPAGADQGDAAPGDETPGGGSRDEAEPRLL